MMELPGRSPLAIFQYFLPPKRLWGRRSMVETPSIHSQCGNLGPRFESGLGLNLGPSSIWTCEWMSRPRTIVFTGYLYYFNFPVVWLGFGYIWIVILGIFSYLLKCSFISSFLLKKSSKLEPLNECLFNIKRIKACDSKVHTTYKV